MALIIGNIGRNDAAINTSAPFVTGSKLALGGQRLQDGLFLSVRIAMAPGAVLPARLARVERVRDNGMDITFVDARNTELGRWRCVYPCVDDMYCTSFIVDSHNNIIGHVAYRRDLADILWSLSANKAVESEKDDFRLLPQCHMADTSYGIRHVQINGVIMNGDIDILPGHYVLTDADQTGLAYSVCAPPNNSEAYSSIVNGLCHLTINHVRKMNGVDCTPTVTEDLWIGGCNLLVKAGVTSNLRVITTDNGPIIRSVLDG